MSYTVTLYCSSNVNLLFPNIMGFFGVCVSLISSTVFTVHFYVLFSVSLWGRGQGEKTVWYYVCTQVVPQKSEND